MTTDRQQGAERASYCVGIIYRLRLSVQLLVNDYDVEEKCTHAVRRLVSLIRSSTEKEEVCPRPATELGVRKGMSQE